MFSRPIGPKSGYQRTFEDGKKHTRHFLHENHISLYISPPLACPQPPNIKAPEAELQLETPRFLVRIRIRGTKCRLLGPDLPELRNLLEAPGMGAGCLIMELERAGKEKSVSNGRGGRGAEQTEGGGEENAALFTAFYFY